MGGRVGGWAGAGAAGCLSLQEVLLQGRPEPVLGLGWSCLGARQGRVRPGLPRGGPEIPGLSAGCCGQTRHRLGPEFAVAQRWTRAHCHSLYDVTMGSPLWLSDHPRVSSRPHWNPSGTGHGAHGNVGGWGAQKQTNNWPRWPRPYLNRTSIPTEELASRPGPALWGWGCPPGSRQVWAALLPGLAAFLCSGSMAGWVGRRGCLWGLGRVSSGQSGKAGRDQRPQRRCLKAGGSMAGSLPPGRTTGPPESCHALPGRARLHLGFAESADLLSPQARLGGDRKALAACLGHC